MTDGLQRRADCSPGYAGDTRERIATAGQCKKAQGAGERRDMVR